MKKKKTEKWAQEEKTFFVGSNSVASANECTGLMPTPATRDDKKESYSDIYEVPVKGKDKDNRL